MIAIGFGASSGCSIDGLIFLLRDCREDARLALGDTSSIGVFTVDRPAHRDLQPTIEAMLGLPVILIQPADLMPVADRVVTQSQRSLSHYGVGSVAEAAALVGAGPEGRLLAPRRVFDKATCAIATTTSVAATDAKTPGAHP